MREKLIACQLALPHTLEGCTEEQIDEIKVKQRVNFLPEIYRQFLLWMGRNAGDLYLGSDYTCNRLLHLKDEANSDFERFGHTFRFADDVFVFMSHGGYVYWYFDTKDKNDDPSVYMYHESNRVSVKVDEHLSQFFDDSIRELAPQAFEEYMKRNLDG